MLPSDLLDQSPGSLARADQLCQPLKLKKLRRWVFIGLDGVSRVSTKKRPRRRPGDISVIFWADGGSRAVEAERLLPIVEAEKRRKKS